MGGSLLMKAIIFSILSLTIFSSHCLGKNSLIDSDFTEAAFDLTTKQKADSNKNWQLTIEAGATITAGNTDTQSYNGKITGAFYRTSSRFSYFAQLLQKNNNGERRVDKWKLGGKANWDFTKTNSSFLSLEYEEDRFATNKSLATLATGYTHRLYDKNDIMWDADIGPGVRRTTVEASSDDSSISSEILTVFHLGTNIMLPLSRHAEFAQILVSDFGLGTNESTVIRSETAMTASVLDNLKMKVSYALRRDSMPGVDKEKLDTQTSITLLMTF